MLRVLIEGYSSNLGGVERFILHLVKVLPKDKFQIDLLVFSEEIPARSQLEKYVDEIITIPSRRTQPLLYGRNIQRVLQKGHYSIVWSNKCSLSDMRLLVEAKKLGVPMRISYAHTSGSMGGFLTRLLHQMNKKKLSAANYKWACSDEVWDYFYDSTDPKEKTVFLNAVFPEDYRYDEEQRTNIRYKLGMEESIILGSVGRLRDEKNHRFIIQLLPELIKRYPSIIYLILGRGELLDELKHVAEKLNVSKHVKFMGFVDNVNDYLNAMDLFLMPSKYEGLPYVLIEAQMNGLEVIASENISSESSIGNAVKFLPLEPTSWIENISNFVSEMKFGHRDSARDFNESPYNMHQVGQQIERRINKSFSVELND